MKLHRSLYAAVGVCAVAWAGCSTRSGGQSSPAGQSTGDSSASIGPAAPAQATLAGVEPAHFGAVVDKYRGKVLLVDFWATWCEPCKALFPHTVAMSRELASTGLAVVSVSLDDADQEPEIRAFLADQQAGFENLRAATGTSAESFKALGIDSGVPCIQLYDRSGKLRRTFSPPVSPAGVEEAVKRLLAEPASAGRSEA
jgi:thiol-disulfide isomerase/thioredoxin